MCVCRCLHQTLEVILNPTKPFKQPHKVLCCEVADKCALLKTAANNNLQDNADKEKQHRFFKGCLQLFKMLEKLYMTHKVHW